MTAPAGTCIRCGDPCYGAWCPICMADDEAAEMSALRPSRRSLGMNDIPTVGASLLGMVLVFLAIAAIVLLGVWWHTQLEIRAGVPLAQPGPVNVEPLYESLPETTKPSAANAGPR